MSNDSNYSDRTSDLILIVGFCAVLVVATLGLATTTSLSRQLIEPFRAICFFLAVTLFAFHVLGVRGLKNTFLYGAFLLVLLYSYGVLLSASHSGFSMVEDGFVRDFVISLLLLYFVAHLDGVGAETSHLIAKFLLLYVLFVFALTVFSGGFVFSYPPRFVYEYSSDERGRLVQYSQGVSKIYALGAIASGFAFLRSSGAWAVLAISLAFIFILLSFLGGARGDSLAGFIVVAILLIRGKPLLIGFLLCILALGVIGLDVSDLFGQDFVVFQRFMSLFQSMETRGSLVDDALELLINRPDCLMIGCGFGYFQEHYGYTAGLYPHNFILEFVITFGLVVFLALVVLCFVGFADWYRYCGVVDIFQLLFLYFILVSMKSGSLLSAWFVVAALIIYSARGLARVREKSF